MSDREPDDAQSAQQKRSALARWDSEGGAGSLGPQQHDFSSAPPSELHQPANSEPRTVKQDGAMAVTRTDREKYKAAKDHVAALIGFYIHLGVFIAVMVGLFGINYLGSDPWWVQWPLIGWGLGVVGHACLVFSSRSGSMKEWQQRKIKEQMAKM